MLQIHKDSSGSHFGLLGGFAIRSARCSFLLPTIAVFALSPSQKSHNLKVRLSVFDLKWIEYQWDLHYRLQSSTIYKEKHGKYCEYLSHWTNLVHTLVSLSCPPLFKVIQNFASTSQVFPSQAEFWKTIKPIHLQHTPHGCACYRSIMTASTLSSANSPLQLLSISEF